MKIRLILDRLTGKAIMAGDKAVAVRSTSALNIQQTSTLSQADYDALAAKDTTTLYLITGTSGYVKAYIGDSPLYREPEPRTISGTSAIVFSSIDGGRIKSLIRYGKCEQGSVPCVTSITQLGKCEQRNLPAEYTQLDYIEGNGTTSYLNTGIVLNTVDFEIEVDYQYSETSSGTPRMAWGYMGNNNNLPRWGLGIYGGRWLGSVNQTLNAGSPDTKRHTAVMRVFMDGETPMWDGTLDGDELYPAAAFPSNTLSLFTGNTLPVYLFARNNNGTAGNFASVKIYAFRVRKAGVLINNLVPCKRNADNAVGVYDVVSDTFLTGTDLSSGTATVPTPSAPMDIVCNNGAIKVRRQSGLPLEYQRVAWIKSTGSIPITGFKTKSTQEITTVFYREKSGTAYVYSSDSNTSSGTTNTTAYLYSSGGGNWRWNGKAASIAVSIGTEITSIQKKDGVWLNGTKAGSYSNAGNFVSTNDLRLSSGENTTVRIESQTIREGDTVTLDLVAVQRLSDSAYGFYDKVSGNFYTNAEATITAGDPIDDPVEIYTDGEDEVLTVRGKNIFDIDTVGIEQGAITSLEGRNTASNYRVRTVGYVPVKPSTQYTISAVIDGYTSGSSRGVFVLEYAGESVDYYTGINSGWQGPAGYTFTTGATTNFIRIVFGKASDVAIAPEDVTSIQLEYGSTATAYEPYTPQTVTDIPILLSVGNYKDTAELISGLLTHKVGIKVFDGTESWTKGTLSLNYYFCDTSLNSNAENELICNQFTVGTRNVPSIGKICVRVSRNGFLITPNDQTIDTVEKFKQFLAAQYANGTPVIVVYPLATETTETITAHPELTNGKYATAEADGSVDDITVTVTRGVTSTPTPYNPIPVMCNNGEVTGQGATGTPEVLTLSAAGETDQTATVVDLLQVGDYKDTHELVSGVIARRIAACVYDGTQEVGDTYISTTGGKDIGAVIVYPLATPTTEQVTPQPLICHMGTNEVESVCNVSNPLIEIIYPE